MSTNLDWLLPSATGVVGIVIGFVAQHIIVIVKDGGKFIYDFRRDAAQRRSAIYDELRKIFDGTEFDDLYDAMNDYISADEAIKQVTDDAPQDVRVNAANDLLLAQERVKKIPAKERGAFANFIEHVALVTQSGFISYPLAHYEFGYYAIRCYECDEFWHDLEERDSPYWALYGYFIKRLIIERDKLKEDPETEIKKLRF